MAMGQLFVEKREEILRIANSYAVIQVRVFGSVARGGEDVRSNVDSLIELAPGRSFFDLGGIQFELESLPERRVDVVTERGWKRRMRDRVLRESVAL